MFEKHSSHSFNSALDRMSTAFMNLLERKEEYNSGHQSRRYKKRRHLLQFGHCQQIGKGAPDSMRSSGYDVGTLLQSYTPNKQSKWQSDCMPSTPEAFQYACRMSTGNVQHLSSQRVLSSDQTESERRAVPTCGTVVSSSDAEPMRARHSRAGVNNETTRSAGEADAKCCTVLSGSDAVHTEANHSREVPGIIPLSKSLSEEQNGLLVQEVVVESTPQADRRACVHHSPLRSDSPVVESKALKAVTSVGQPQSRMGRRKAFASPFSFTFSKQVQEGAPSPVALPDAPSDSALLEPTAEMAKVDEPAAKV